MENPVNKSNTLIDAEPTVRMSVRFVTPGGHAAVHQRPDLRRRVGWEKRWLGMRVQRKAFQAPCVAMYPQASVAETSPCWGASNQVSTNGGSGTVSARNGATEASCCPPVQWLSTKPYCRFSYESAGNGKNETATQTATSLPSLVMVMPEHRVADNRIPSPYAALAATLTAPGTERSLREARVTVPGIENICRAEKPKPLFEASC
ncbi:hypothetical protein Anapl_17919 [Anas platyrhynchos]|uniref:Uncharacterized protein n=1 Tax=Anas platyrhynchos TaxID=8839 RepID=R0J9U5_ANAPL|nr:hypothetical protein Anapl_17919 [Anas platyrhynchos]